MDIENATGEGMSPEELLELHAKLDAGEPADSAEAVNNGTEPTPGSEAQGKQEANESNQQSQDDEANVEGVATKDGKHVIPYSVLKGERERAIRAEQLLREAHERLNQMEQQSKPGSEAKDGGTAPTEPEATDELSDADLEALKEDFPTVYAGIQAAMARTKALEAKLQPVEQSIQQQEQNRQRTEADQIQDAIDAVPKLAHIQSNDKAAFQTAVQFDQLLRIQPEWADRPMEERFAKVVEMVESVKGTITLPNGQKSLSAAEMAAAARAKAAETAKAKGTQAPISLSEAPPGVAPAADEIQALEQMNPLQLAAKFDSMTPEQIDAYLSTI